MILPREIATKKRVSARGRSVRTESGERKWQRSKTEANRVFYSCSCVHIRAFGLAGSLARGQDSRRNRYDSTSVGEETDKQWVGGGRVGIFTKSATSAAAPDSQESASFRPRCSQPLSSFSVCARHVTRPTSPREGQFGRSPGRIYSYRTADVTTGGGSFHGSTTKAMLR